MQFNFLFKLYIGHEKQLSKILREFAMLNKFYHWKNMNLILSIGHQ